MQPLVRGALAAAVLAALGTAGSALPSRPPPAPKPRTLPSASAVPSGDRVAQLAGRCPERTLPLADGDSLRCLPLPMGSADPARLRREAAGKFAPLKLRLDDRARDFIPLLPRRPAAYSRYLWPLAPDDVDLALNVDGDSFETRYGMVLAAPAGSVVRLADLERQLERPQVLLVGELHGVTVAVLHRVEIGGTPRDYIAIYGQLDRPGPQIVAGNNLKPSAVIGYLPKVSASGKPNAPEPDVDLYFEIRKGRGSVDDVRLLSRLTSTAISGAVDPRNVLQVIGGSDPQGTPLPAPSASATAP